MRHALTILLVLLAGALFGQTRLDLKQLEKAADSTSIVATGPDSLAKYVLLGYGFYFDGDSLAVDTSVISAGGESSADFDTALVRTIVSDSIQEYTRVAGYGIIDDGDTLSVDTTVISGGSGGGGLASVTSDATLTGLGTGGNPLKVDTSIVVPFSVLADTASAIRTDFPAGFSGSYNDLSDVPANIDEDSTDDINWSDTTSTVAAKDWVNTRGFLTSFTESDPVWISDSSTYAAKSLLADSTAAVRADIPDVSGFITSESDPVWISDSADYTLKAVLADTAAAIRSAIPTTTGGDGVATSGSLDTSNEEIDVTVTGASNFSIDISGIENLASFSGWDTNASDDFSGAWGDLSSVPAGFADNVDNVDDADASTSNELQTLSWSAGTGGNDEITLSDGGGTVTITDNDTQLSESEVEAFIDGDETSFSGWDKNAADDFSGSYNDLTGVPTNIDEDSTNDIEWSDTTATIAAKDWVNTRGFLTSFTEADPVWISDSADYTLKTVLADTAAAIRADFPTGGGDVSFSDTTATIATKTDIEEVIYFDSTQVGSSFTIDFADADRGVQMLDLNAQASATLSSVSNTPAGALFTLWITNANSSGTTLTLPSSFVQADGTAITSNQVDVNSGDRITILYNSDSSTYYTTILE